VNGLLPAAVAATAPQFGQEHTVTKILIVDDSSFQRRTIRRALAQEGYQIIEAGDGAQAMQIIASEAPDCILTDLIMPGTDGFAVLEALRDRHSHVPIIVVTADIQGTTRQRCLELGAAGFIQKPINEADVRAAVQRAIQQPDEPAP
jgi:CheY-like chemotaxis protein